MAARRNRVIKVPDPGTVRDETLLRLAVAAALEFPDGSMTASGLRAEARQGHLRIWKIAGKHYTTKQALQEMRNLCVQSNRPDSNCAEHVKAAAIGGSLNTKSAKSAQAAAKASAQRLKSRSRNTSPKADNHPSATVIPLKS
jgi:hypothetical protein